MGEAEAFGVEGLAVERFKGFAGLGGHVPFREVGHAVDRVAKNRVAGEPQVHTNLVCTASFWSRFKQCVTPKPFQNIKVSTGELPSMKIHYRSVASISIYPQGQLYRPPLP